MNLCEFFPTKRSWQKDRKILSERITYYTGKLTFANVNYIKYFLCLSKLLPSQVSPTEKHLPERKEKSDFTQGSHC